jgi:hypothetical protein
MTDTVSPHTFKIDLDEEVNFRPLVLVTPKKPKSDKIKMPQTYPKYEEDFFDTLKSCAGYIDQLGTVELKIKYNKELNKIFLIRHHGSLMRLFRDLWAELNI